MGWPLKEQDLKRYPHFDAPISIDELTRIATDPDAVATNPFFPFLLYYKKWQPFRKRNEAGQKKEKKNRPIRYACRRDSAIFSYYRWLLSARYETMLVVRGIQGCPIAYRKIAAPNERGGKCNIDFAAEAFADVRALSPCCVVTLDIQNFFECLDHERLRSVWCEMLEVSVLPPDHAAVFKAITRSAVVDRDAAYKRLGYIGEVQRPDGSTTIGYRQFRNEIPVQLCSTADFRRKICGKGSGSGPSLIKRNDKPYGIVQGAPLSDLLANMYLLHFDECAALWVRNRGGKYYRYSDDIFIVVPGGEKEGREVEAYVTEQIAHHGDHLQVKKSKTSITSFTNGHDGTIYPRRFDRPQSTGGLEYLGFRFDGRAVYLRDSTLSRLRRNIVFAARRRARKVIRKHPGQDFEFLKKAFNPAAFEAHYGRVREFKSADGPRSWTFRTYVKRCTEVFKDADGTFFRQIRGLHAFIAETVDREIRKAMMSAYETNES